MNLERIVAAIRTINRLHNLGDAIYDVRQREDNIVPEGKSSWEGSLVTEYNEAHKALREEGVL